MIRIALTDARTTSSSARRKPTANSGMVRSQGQALRPAPMNPSGDSYSSPENPRAGLATLRVHAGLSSSHCSPRGRLARSAAGRDHCRDQSEEYDQCNDVVKVVFDHQGSALLPASVATSWPSRSSTHPSSRRRWIFASLTFKKFCRPAMISRSAQRRAISSIISVMQNPMLGTQQPREGY